MSQIIENYLDNLDNTVEVGKDSYNSSASEVLVADGLGTCLGIAAYSSGTGKGYLLHAGTWENENLEEMVEEFIGEFESREEPYEVLIGGTMSSKYNPLTKNDFTGNARQLVEKTLDEREIQYESAWTEDPVYNRMIISPELGILYDRPEE